MKKSYITLIIVVISIALVGLVGIQIYWISNAIGVKETNFNRLVNEAVSTVIYKLEKIEVANQIKQKQSLYMRGSDLFKKIDSINYLYYSEMESLNEESSGVASSPSKGSISIQLSETRNGEDILYVDTTVDADNQPIVMLRPDDENMIDPEKEPDERFDQLIDQKSSLFNDVLDDMFTFSRFENIEDRVDKGELDSLLAHELKAKGIETEFEYGIFSSSRNKLVMQKTGMYAPDLLDEKHAFVLFPSDMFVMPDYLMIYFPKEKRYLVTQMSGMLTISIILILIIVVSFVFTINSVIKEKKLAQLKTDFINNMTHEFKTPISTISLACEALRDKDIKITEELSSTYINIINDENKRLGTMSEKILQTAILEKGKLKLKKEPVDIHNIIIDVIKNIGIQVEINDGKIIQQFKASSPVIQADKMHLMNVIFNLLENANKYSPKKPEIHIITRNVAGGVEISVKDNGIGISKSEQKKIFDKLYRIPTGDIHNFKGFGLGLSYVKAIVDEHGGNITLESEIDKGSTFTIYLPSDK